MKSRTWKKLAIALLLVVSCVVLMSVGTAANAPVFKGFAGKVIGTTQGDLHMVMVEAADGTRMEFIITAETYIDEGASLLNDSAVIIFYDQNRKAGKSTNPKYNAAAVVKRGEKVLPMADFLKNGRINGRINREPHPKTPARIVISSIDVDSKITAMGLDSNGAMAMPQGPRGISWYNKSAYPGYSGNAIIAGHNEWNNTPGTFVDLHKLTVGDTVEIYYYDGTKGIFEVISRDVYLLKDAPFSIMAPYGPPRTTLITCAGSKLKAGGYDSRLIVILKAVELPD